MIPEKKTHFTSIPFKTSLDVLHPLWHFTNSKYLLMVTPGPKSRLSIQCSRNIFCHIMFMSICSGVDESQQHRGDSSLLSTLQTRVKCKNSYICLDGENITVNKCTVKVNYTCWPLLSFFFLHTVHFLRSETLKNN